MNGPVSSPRFAVIIPARNAEAYLGETLDSLDAQTDRDFEVVVVDDGSTDATAAIAREHGDRDPRFGTIAGPGRGVSAARNLGLSHSTAPVVLFLDADDLLLPDSLARFRAALDASDAPAALGVVARIAEDGSPLPGNDNVALAGTDDHLTKLLQKNFVVNGGALAIRRETIEASGGYDTDLAYGEDWEFWCRLAERGDFALIPGAPVLSYRQRASGANYRARGSVLARNVPCLMKISANRSLRNRYGGELDRILRKRQIDIFWSGVRSEFQFGSRLRALVIAFGGILLYPDSIARPSLALRFIRSLGSK
ncbi:glycosyltransferase family A protein [Ostreiculturibacter nitratireducens]|uniref:glycosyltransferase family 2 protein n=1 Tax=Ostreiculturibacter nitratireducens TaxID=3075226 RepID=UPI0031B571C4